MVSNSSRFSRRALIGVDICRYGQRSGSDQKEVQARLVQTLDAAAKASFLDRSTWEIQQSGDGEIAILPDGVAELDVIDSYVPAIFRHLAAGNEAAPASFLQLRVVAHFGVNVAAASGFAGPAAVVVGRLLDARAVKNVLEHTGAPLSFLLSNELFNDTVAQAYTRTPPSRFRKVRVDQKEFAGHAWLTVPGINMAATAITAAMSATEPATERQPDEAPTGGPATSVESNFFAPVYTENGQWGIQYNHD